jgi:ornithine cyclodeaminase
LRYLLDQLETTGSYDALDMIADPDDPRDMFGMVRRAKEIAA